MFAENLIDLARLWLKLGCAVSVLFLSFGIDRVDEDARGAYVFRILLVPGILLIWPLVLWRWVRHEIGADNWLARYRAVRAPHLGAAVLLGVSIGFIVLAGWQVRQSWPSDITPEFLGEVVR